MSRLVIACTFALAALITPGCNIVGPLQYAVEGPGKIEPDFVLLDVPTVVYVDDRTNAIPSNSQVIRREIGETVTNALLVIHPFNEVAPLTDAIRTADAMMVADAADREEVLLPMDEIGRRVGAEQIIYIDIRQFSMGDDRFSPRPTATAEVRVLDVTNRVRLYPYEGEAPPSITSSLRQVDASLLNSRTSRTTLSKTLAFQLGTEIARLFYTYEAGDLGEGLSAR